MKVIQNKLPALKEIRWRYLLDVQLRGDNCCYLMRNEAVVTLPLKTTGQNVPDDTLIEQDIGPNIVLTILHSLKLLSFCDINESTTQLLRNFTEDITPFKHWNKSV